MVSNKRKFKLAAESHVFGTRQAVVRGDPSRERQLVPITIRKAKASGKTGQVDTMKQFKWKNKWFKRGPTNAESSKVLA